MNFKLCTMVLPDIFFHFGYEEFFININSFLNFLRTYFLEILPKFCSMQNLKNYMFVTSHTCK
jgi:hypothetical protein